VIATPQQISGTPFLSPDHPCPPLDLSHVGRGGCCFIVLSGPSLRTHDLQPLSRRGVYTIGVNNSPAVVRPQAWITIDPLVKFHESIWLDPAVMKFVPHKFTERGDTIRTRLPDGRLAIMQRQFAGEQNPRSVRCTDCPNVFAFTRNSFLNPETWLAEPSINWGNCKRSHAKNKRPRGLSVFPAALKLAWSLGFRTVFLLGCDFNMQAQNPYAFAEEFKQVDPAGKVVDVSANVAGGNNDLFRAVSAWMELLQPHFLSAGFKIFNCNSESRLTVFPFRPYHQCIGEATAGIPQSLETSGWYTK